ncbi:MAG: alginate export family protein [Abditibacteriales bacterium]|nr:alginate export family protein [Abditibacteriales bacterium]MDW8366474.1 alginate export family protein [Abditibacteriales bacterium]
MKKGWLLGLNVTLLSVVVLVQGQAGTEAPPTGWTVTPTLRTRIESWRWFDPGNPPVGKDNRYVFMGQILRVPVAKQGKKTDALVELAVPMLFALPNDAVAAPPQGQLGMGASYKAANDGQYVGVFFKQAALTFKGALGENTHLKVGRFEFNEGVEFMTGDPTLDWIKRERIGYRLIGNFGFSHVGRSADGVHVSRNTKGSNLTFVAARPTVGVFDLDGNKGIDDVGYVYLGLTHKGSPTTYDGRLFYILYKDDRRLAKVDNSGGASGTGDISISTFGGHYARKLGKADVLLWGAVQRGDWGAHDHKASAVNLEFGYQPTMKGQPWIRIGTFRSSGDSVGTDGKHETFFLILTTPRLYARFPFFNQMNLRDDFVMLILRPNPKTVARLDLHRLRLADAGDRWYLGGGAFQQGTFGYAGRPSGGNRDLATLLDVSVDYKLTAHTTVTLYLSRAIGGKVVSAIYPNGRRASLFYVEVMNRF